MWGGMNLICPPPPNCPFLLSIFQSCHPIIEQNYDLVSLKRTQIGWKSVFSVQLFTAVTWLLCGVLFLKAPGVLEGLLRHP